MHSLATTLTPFIGRSKEIDEIGRLMEDPSCRLLTLVGQGGIGKTRLAMEVASRQQAAFPDGIFFVALTSLNRVDDILTAITEAMPFHLRQDNRAPREQFFAYLHEKQAKRLLLILDNFEHLLPGVDIVSEILAATTGLKILVTSREALNLQEEWVRPIHGLAYPDHVNGQPLEDYSAVQLFVDRARRIRGDFDLARESRSVVQICQLVEGMPLAIELAVGWLKTLQPADIAREIQQNMDILATRVRNIPERHRSIRSIFAHSWHLMSDDEREVFQKLSLFRGGFTREAAQAVTGTSLQTLAALVDKSLIRLRETGRYDVHELMRQYGAEHLEAVNQTTVVHRAYFNYYLCMLHQLEKDIKAHHQIAALDTIAADFENIRHAWPLAVQQGQFADLGQAVESLHFFADMRGRYHEVAALFRTTLEQFPQTLDPVQMSVRDRIRARLIRLILLGNLRIVYPLREQIDACLAAARARQDQSEIGFCLLVSGIVSIWDAANERPYLNGEAAEFFKQGYAVYEAVGDLFYCGEALGWVAASTPNDNGRKDAATVILRQSLALRREIGDRNGIAWITLNLTEAMILKLDYPECERYSREALALMREIGSVKGALQAMSKLAVTTMFKGDLEESRVLVEEMSVLADETNNLDSKWMSTGLLACLVCLMDEDYREGAALAEKSHALSLEPFFGGHNDLGVRRGRAIAACGLGDYEAARVCYPFLFWDRSDDPSVSTICFALEAAARAHEGALDDAAELLGLAFHQPAWANGWLHRWPLLARLRADLRLQLGEDRYQAAWERGSRHDLNAVIDSLLQEPADISRLASQPAPIEPLSERELEVLSLISDGLSNREIAERLFLSVGTVKVHTRNIYGKLNVGSRTQALAQAAKLNLL